MPKTKVSTGDPAEDEENQVSRQRKSEKRRSSILKSNRLSDTQNINPKIEVTQRVSRRVSFAETYVVKEFVKESPQNWNNDSDKVKGDTICDTSEFENDTSVPDITGFNKLLTGVIHDNHDDLINEDDTSEINTDYPEGFSSSDRHDVHTGDVEKIGSQTFLSQFTRTGHKSRNILEYEDLQNVDVEFRIDSKSIIEKLRGSGNKVNKETADECDKNSKVIGTDVTSQNRSLKNPGLQFYRNKGLSDITNYFKNEDGQPQDCTKIFGTGDEMDFTCVNFQNTSAVTDIDIRKQIGTEGGLDITCQNILNKRNLTDEHTRIYEDDDIMDLTCPGIPNIQSTILNKNAKNKNFTNYQATSFYNCHSKTVQQPLEVSLETSITKETISETLTKAEPTLTATISRPENTGDDLSMELTCQFIQDNSQSDVCSNPNSNSVLEKACPSTSEVNTPFSSGVLEKKLVKPNTQNSVNLKPSDDTDVMEMTCQTIAVDLQSSHTIIFEKGNGLAAMEMFDLDFCIRNNSAVDELRESKSPKISADVGVNRSPNDKSTALPVANNCHDTASEKIKDASMIPVTNDINIPEANPNGISENTENISYLGKSQGIKDGVSAKGKVAGEMHDNLTVENEMKMEEARCNETSENKEIVYCQKATEEKHDVVAAIHTNPTEKLDDLTSMEITCNTIDNKPIYDNEENDSATETTCNTFSVLTNKCYADLKKAAVSTSIKITKHEITLPTTEQVTENNKNSSCTEDSENQKQGELSSSFVKLCKNSQMPSVMELTCLEKTMGESVSETKDSSLLEMTCQGTVDASESQSQSETLCSSVRKTAVSSRFPSNYSHLSDVFAVSSSLKRKIDTFDTEIMKAKAKNIKLLGNSLIRKDDESKNKFTSLNEISKDLHSLKPVEKKMEIASKTNTKELTGGKAAVPSETSSEASIMNLQASDSNSYSKKAPSEKDITDYISQSFLYKPSTTDVSRFDSAANVETTLSKLQLSIGSHAEKTSTNRTNAELDNAEHSNFSLNKQPYNTDLLDSEKVENTTGITNHTQNDLLLTDLISNEEKSSSSIQNQPSFSTISCVIHDKFCKKMDITHKDWIKIRRSNFSVTVEKDNLQNILETLVLKVPKYNITKRVLRYLADEEESLKSDIETIKMGMIENQPQVFDLTDKADVPELEELKEKVHLCKGVCWKKAKLIWKKKQISRNVDYLNSMEDQQLILHEAVEDIISKTEIVFNMLSEIETISAEVEMEIHQLQTNSFIDEDEQIFQKQNELEETNAVIEDCLREKMNFIDVLLSLDSKHSELVDELIESSDLSMNENQETVKQLQLKSQTLKWILQWELQEHSLNHSVFLFFHGFLQLTVIFETGKLITSCMSLVSNVSDDTTAVFRLAAKLALDACNRSNLKERYSSRSALPQLLHEVSVIVGNLQTSAEEINNISLQNTVDIKDKYITISIRNLAKSRKVSLTFPLSELGYPCELSHYDIIVHVGSVNVNNIRKHLEKVTPGSKYCLQLVKEIKNYLQLKD